MILLASTCISQIFGTLVRLCKCAYRFEYNLARNPSDGYVHDQATVTSIRKSSTRNFFTTESIIWGWGHPSTVPVGLWCGSSGIATAVSLTLANVLLTRCTGVESLQA